MSETSSDTNSPGIGSSSEGGAHVENKPEDTAVDVHDTSTSAEKDTVVFHSTDDVTNSVIVEYQSSASAKPVEDTSVTCNRDQPAIQVTADQDQNISGAINDTCTKTAGTAQSEKISCLNFLYDIPETLSCGIFADFWNKHPCFALLCFAVYFIMNGFAVFAIVSGSISIGNCSVTPELPYSLIVFGTLSLVKVNELFFKNILRFVLSDHNCLKAWKQHSLWKHLFVLWLLVAGGLDIIIGGLTILTLYWTVKAYTQSLEDDPNSAENGHCDEFIINSSWVCIFGLLGILMLFLMFLLCSWCSSKGIDDSINDKIRTWVNLESNNSYQGDHFHHSYYDVGYGGGYFGGSSNYYCEGGNNDGGGGDNDCGRGDYDCGGGDYDCGGDCEGGGDCGGCD